MVAYTQAQFPSGIGMVSGWGQGRWLTMLARLVNPSLIVEVGTFTGYAALCLAEGLQPGGRLITLERDERLRSWLTELFQRPEAPRGIESRIGMADQLLEEIEGPIDMAFVDADKQAYTRYLDLLLPKMRPGGLILFDNVLWKGRVLAPEQAEEDKNTTFFRSFNKALAADPRLETVFLPYRDGVAVARVKLKV